MSNFRKALLINFASSSGATAVQFLVSILLARMLTPSEIGIYSITIVLVNIAHVFRDFGVALYLQREQHLTNDKIRSAMGVLYTSTWIIALVIFLAGDFVAAYFGYAEVKPVMQVLALGFLFIPFSSVMLSLLIRDYAAVKIAWSTLAGTVAYASTCLGLAYLGFGTMSLAWANVANIVATGFAYLPFRPAGLPWLPSFRNWGGVMKFGSGALLTNALNAVNNALPDLLLAKIGSAHQVGLVSRANSTVNIFTNIAGSAINFGSLPYLASAHHRSESLEPIVNRAVALVTGIGWPALAMTALLGHEVVMVLYGQAWLESVPAIPALAIAAGIGMLFQYSGTAFTAIGRPYLAAIPVAFTAIGRILLATALFTGSVESFTWVLLAATVLTIPPQIYLQRQFLQIRLSTMLKSIWPSVQVTAVTAIACKLALLLASEFISSAMLKLLVVAPFLAIVWYVAVRVTAHPLNDEIKIFGRALIARIKPGLTRI